MYPTLIAETTTRERLIPVGSDAWRVIDRSGRALGHVKRADDRFLARRFHVPTATFRELGAFRSVDDACACLRGQ